MRAVVAIGILLATVGTASAQTGFDTSSYPRPGPQPNFMDQLGQAQRLQMQQQQLEMGRMQLERQRLQDPDYRRQIEFERQQAEAYRKRHPEKR
jgi:hypothetical protein